MNKSKKFPIALRRTNEDRVYEILDFGVTGMMVSHMFEGYEDIKRLSEDAESFLSEKEIPKDLRPGTQVRAISGARQKTKRTKIRPATYVRLLRTRSGWSLLHASQTTIDHDGGRVIYEMTDDQAIFLMNRASKKIFVKGNEIEWENGFTRFMRDIDKRLSSMLSNS